MSEAQTKFVIGIRRTNHGLAFTPMWCSRDFSDLTRSQARVAPDLANPRRSTEKMTKETLQCLI